MEMSSDKVLLISRLLLSSFVTLLTLWYFMSPYLVKPSPIFTEKMRKSIETETNINSNINTTNELVIENWTKWRLYLYSDKKVIILPDSKLSFLDLTFPIHATFEWRRDYSVEIQKDSADDTFTARVHKPWYGFYGLYDHFHVEVEESVVRLVPNFLFGLPQYRVDHMIGGADKVPSRGILTDNTDHDRIIIQCFMNLIILTVIFLLWANNPVIISRKLVDFIM